MQYDALMEQSSHSLAVAIGLRVRQQRQDRRWTLEKLAALSGVSRRMLINVEQGTANPSIGTLLKISEALGIVLPALVDPPAPKPVRITPAGEGPVLWSGPGGGRGMLVSHIRAPEVVELWDWEMAPEDRHSSEAHTAGTRELLHVLEGSLLITVDGEAHTLMAGDALTFEADVPHAYENPHDEWVRFSMTVFEPVASAGATT